MFWKANRWLILSSLILALLPLCVFFIPSFQTEYPVMVWVSLTTLISTLLNAGILIYTGSKLDGANRKLSLRMLLLILTVQYGINIIIVLGLSHEEIQTGSLFTILLGLVFIVLGNMLPKSEPNPLFGVRTKWSLENRENWVKTSRITGWIWVMAGLICWLNILIQVPPMVSVIILAAAGLCPGLISWLIYKKQVKEGTWLVDLDTADENGMTSKTLKLSFGMFGLVAVVVICLIAFGGRYSLRVENGDLKADTLLVPSLNLDLDTVENISLDQPVNPGERTFGYSALGTDLGNYRNSEYGNYRRFTGKSPLVIVLKGPDGTVVVSEQTEQATQDLYDQIMAAMNPD